MEFEKVSFSDMMVGVCEEEESRPFMSRAWRWSGIKQATNKTLVSMIDTEGEFKFLPYIYTPSGVVPLSHYEEHNRDNPLSR